MSTTAPALTLRERIDTEPMSGFQWLVVGLCVLLNALDGFDVMAMAFTATPVSEEFGLSGSQLGLLLSVGLVGMAAGSLFIAPLADVVGRRTVVVASMALAAVGMFLGALSPTAGLLGGSRVLTGLGVGGILASTNVIASEFSSVRRRGLAIGLYTAGYGIGATLGGLAAVGLTAEYGWRAIFLTGAIASAVVAAVLVVLLPESPDFLVSRRPARALERLNRVAGRLGRPPAESLDAEAGPAATRPTSRGLGSVLGGDLRRSTLLVWVAFFATMFGFYFVNSWTPRLLSDAGLSEQQAATGGLVLAFGGTLGSVLYGVVCTWADARRVLIAFTVLSAGAMVLFISTTSWLGVALAVGVAVGALINGCIAGLYTITPALYGPTVRSTGMGWGIGVGRIGAILAPLAAGGLVDASWSPVQLYVGAASVVLVSAVALALMGRGPVRLATSTAGRRRAAA